MADVGQGTGPNPFSGSHIPWCRPVTLPPIRPYKPPERFELPTPWVVARCSLPLSYGGKNAGGAHGRRDGNSIAFGPGSRVRLTPWAPRSRRPTVRSCTTSVRPSVVKQRLCEWCSWAMVPMRIAPPATSAGGAIDSLPHSVRWRGSLRDAPLLRVACNSGALVFVSADLLSLSVDPQPAGRDAAGAGESRSRARARPAQAGRAEISEWEIDGRFHRSSLVYIIGCLARPRHRSCGHAQMQSRASMLSRPCGERSRWQLRTTGGEVP
jgi:hypothetical protein